MDIRLSTAALALALAAGAGTAAAQNLSGVWMRPAPASTFSSAPPPPMTA